MVIDGGNVLGTADGGNVLGTADGGNVLPVGVAVGDLVGSGIVTWHSPWIMKLLLRVVSTIKLRSLWQLLVGTQSSRAHRLRSY